MLNFLLYFRPSFLAHLMLIILCLSDFLESFLNIEN